MSKNQSQSMLKVDKPIIFSCIIPASAKDLGSQNLKDLITSIKSQDFPQDQIEILVITEGDSEQAKGIGIKQSTGEICAMFCADNMIMEKDLFKKVNFFFSVDKEANGYYPWKYTYVKHDNSLNRYFSLIGGNDPICYYLGKNDRHPHVDSLRITSDYQPSYGCNGFFYRASAIKATNLNNYYPMDNAMEVGPIESLSRASIWHRTSDNLLTFLKKRYRYAKDLYCDRRDRRWRMLDTREDYLRLAWFIGVTVLVIPSVCISIRGFLKIRDWAWAWHWPACFGFLVTYTILVIRNLFKYGRFFQCRQPV